MIKINHEDFCIDSLFPNTIKKKEDTVGLKNWSRKALDTVAQIFY